MPSQIDLCVYRDSGSIFDRGPGRSGFDLPYVLQCPTVVLLPDSYVVSRYQYPLLSPEPYPLLALILMLSLALVLSVLMAQGWCQCHWLQSVYCIGQAITGYVSVSNQASSQMLPLHPCTMMTSLSNEASQMLPFYTAYYDYIHVP